ncbi:MAG: hypothetical protein GY796_09855 [Chloroflexi bacterium]|nr:hypothetical protein [Chloroflexota bacterium]
MSETDGQQPENPFDTDTWAQLPALLEHLPEPVHIIVWGDETAAARDAEATHLCQTLATRFANISTQTLPRRINYDYWPVLGMMRGTAANYEDMGVRIIGLPDGYGMTAFITAVQAVSFRGMTSEVRTRIQLTKLKEDVRLELITAANNKAGSLMSQPLFNMAVINPHIRAFMIMADQFPVIVDRYSVNYLPHTVVNGRVHIEGVVDEVEILKHMATAVQA